MSKLSIKSTITLNSGHKVPILGLGVYQSHGPDCFTAVTTALKHGIRHFDTAEFYRNEKEVADAIKKSGVPRDEIFYTTKIWDSSQGYASTTRHIDEIVEYIDYIDLLLIHSPYPGKTSRLETWKAIEEAIAQGKVKSGGVSNYGVKHIKEILDSKYPPSMNQIELHPWLQQEEITSFCKQNGVNITCYSPLARGQKFGDTKIKAIADNYNKSIAQVLIRWSLQKGYVSIPKSSNAERVKENSNVFDFEISEEDLRKIADLEENYKSGWDPTTAD